MKLFLIRHGRSFANEEKLVTGNTDDSLSPEGIKQVEDLKVWLKNIPLEGDIFIASQWKRAQQTAELLWPDVEWQINPAIGETNAGDACDWKLNEFLIQYPDFHQFPNASYPGGESHNQLNERSLHWLKELLSSCNNDDSVVLVAHAGPISCLLQAIVNITMNEFPAFIPLNASLSVVNFIDNDINKSSIIGFSLCSEKMLAKKLLELP